MEKILQNIRTNTKLISIVQTIVFIFVILYVLMFLSGGLFTTFFIMLIACFVGVIAALLMLIRKSFLWAIVDLAAAGSMFIYFIYNA
ncbi:hypothetical protein MKX41_06975 [Paenibacillus sp. FSL R5-0475]|uniref:hypothetical protein n=1 Tax=unclassified Paenibacillus TaxID=185978 RepID=UPI0030DB258D